MVIETPEGAILEIFWRPRGFRIWSQVTALRLLSRYHVDREGLSGLRWLLSRRLDTGRTWRESDSDILQRTASLIATGRIIVAEHRGTRRWPASGFSLGSGHNSALLFWRDQLNLERDLYTVQQWLVELHEVGQGADKSKDQKQSLSRLETTRYLSKLREILAWAPGSPDYGHLADRDLCQVLRAYFESGELLPIYHRFSGVAEVELSAPPPTASAPIARENKSDADEPNTFEGSDDVAPLGTCLVCAAQNGTPFVSVAQPLPPPIGKQNLATEKKQAWIEIELVDMDGFPVAGVNYSVELPDGSVVHGQLSAEGRARHENILPGNCKVTFPDLDGNTWRRL